MMEKDKTICFQTTSDIRNAIEEIAKKEKRSISSVVESIIYQFLSDNKALKSASQNRRRSERKQVRFPTFIGDSRWKRRDFDEGTILDISFGGIRVSIPKATRVTTDNYGEETELSIIFTVPDTLWPIHAKCRPRWVVDSGETFELGASLEKPDFTAYKIMQKYLA